MCLQACACCHAGGARQPDAPQATPDALHADSTASKGAVREDMAAVSAAHLQARLYVNLASIYASQGRYLEVSHLLHVDSESRLYKDRAAWSIFTLYAGMRMKHACAIPAVKQHSSRPISQVALYLHVNWLPCPCPPTRSLMRT